MSRAPTSSSPSSERSGRLPAVLRTASEEGVPLYRRDRRPRAWRDPAGLAHEAADGLDLTAAPRAVGGRRADGVGVP